MSKKIQHLELPFFIEIWILMFAKLFNWEENFIALFSIILVIPKFLKNDYPYPRIYFGMTYYAIAMTGFAMTTFLKRIFSRIRPKHDISILRLLNLRKKEHDNSFPSGDVSMSAAYTTFLYFFLYCIPGGGKRANKLFLQF